jgi:hypothetical protein
MISVSNAADLNEFELIIVMDKLKERGTTWAEIRPGNKCVWVSTGSSSVPINEYFIFNQGKLVDIQVD